MPKLKLWGYPKIYMGCSDDFKFSIQNNECIEIAGNLGWEVFQGFFYFLDVISHMDS